MPKTVKLNPPRSAMPKPSPWVGLAWKAAGFLLALVVFTFARVIGFVDWLARDFGAVAAGGFIVFCLFLLPLIRFMVRVGKDGWND